LNYATTSTLQPPVEVEPTGNPTLSLPYPALVLDGSGVIRSANIAAASALDRTPGDVQDARLVDLVSEPVAAELDELRRRVLDTDEPLIVCVMLRGKWRPWLMEPTTAPPAPPASAGKASSSPADRRAVRMSSSGDRVALMRDLPDAAITLVRVRERDLGDLALLTERELQLLKLIGEGLTTHEIAERLCRSERTVQWHRIALGKKLRAENRVELAHIALDAGLELLPLEEIRRALRRPAEFSRPRD
jgi:DNA-binding CsgD family transcriptional regulator